MDWSKDMVKEKKKKIKKKKKIYKLTILFIVLDLLAFGGFFITYGPISYIRNLVVTTAMKTMEHQYLAYIFYNEEMISNIMNNNYFIALTDDVNLDDIVIDTKEKDSYENEYEKEILTRDEGNDLYKVISLKVGGSNAHLVAIYQPEKLQLLHIEKFDAGGWGERLFQMCDRYGGVLCVNGGGFVDNGYGSDIPVGYVIKDHEIIWSPDGGENEEKDNIIGLTDEGKLVLLSNTSGKEALEAGIKDGLEFGPFLIVNGKPLEIVGDPWGKSPRVAMGQRKDGVMLFLLIDGTNYINGATLQDLVDTLLLYGAYNATNLDGGQSSSLIVNGVLTNNPPAEAKKTNGRWIVTAWGLIP
jgi:exopolysaccharide biosynthesis protein